MPFSFNFYGTTANTLCVDNNGFVLFNTTSCPTSGHFQNTSLPATSLSAPAFMPMWDDFDSESGNVYTDTRGTTPNRQFIVEWFDRVHYSGSTNTDGATFELILNEDGTIQFEYSDVEYTGGATRRRLHRRRLRDDRSAERPDAVQPVLGIPSLGHRRLGHQVDGDRPAGVHRYRLGDGQRRRAESSSSTRSPITGTFPPAAPARFRSRLRTPATAI